MVSFPAEQCESRNISYCDTVGSPYRREIGGRKLPPIRKTPIRNRSLHVLKAIWWADSINCGISTTNTQFAMPFYLGTVYSIINKQVITPFYLGSVYSIINKQVTTPFT